MEGSNDGLGNSFYSLLLSQYVPNEYTQPEATMSRAEILGFQPNVKAEPFQDRHFAEYDDDLPGIAKRQQGWYNQYGKRGINSDFSSTSDLVPVTDQPGVSKISSYHLRAFPRLGMNAGAYFNKRKQVSSPDMASRLFSLSGKDLLPLDDKDVATMRSDIALLRSKLQNIYRNPVVGNFENEREALRGYANSIPSTSEALAGMPLIGSS